ARLRRRVERRSPRRRGAASVPCPRRRAGGRGSRKARELPRRDACISGALSPRGARGVRLQRERDGAADRGSSLAPQRSDSRTRPLTDAQVVTEGGTSLVSGAVVDGYRVGRRIGAGGVGAVFAAVEVASGRAVALKVLRSAPEDPQAAQRFER